MSRRVGRPAVQRAPDERVPLATRVRGSIYNQLIEAAARNDRPLGNEVELRLERSFDPFLPDEDRQLALMFLSTYRIGGLAAVARMLLELGEPDDEEREKRRRLALATLRRPMAPFGLTLAYPEIGEDQS